MIHQGLSERRSLQIVRMSASALRYQPVPDQNDALRERIVALAHRHRRYGAGMIYLKLRQAGLSVNHKRVEGCIPRLGCKCADVDAKRYGLESDIPWPGRLPPTKCGQWILSLIEPSKAAYSSV
jgi:hypothetical protein